MGEAAFFVAKADGEAIDFGFDDIVGVLAVKIFFDAVQKFSEFGFAVGVVQALHPNGVGDGAKGFERGAADFTGGGVFVDEFGVSGFEVEELAVEAIVRGIGNLGLGLDVVQVVVSAYFRKKLRVSLGGSGFHRERRRRARPREMPRISASQSRTETSRPGARRWLCSSRAPRREPVMPRATEG